MSGYSERLAFGTLGDIWGSVLKNSVARFHGISSYFSHDVTVGSSTEQCSPGYFSGCVKKSDCASIATLPTASSFSKLSAVPRCKVAEERRRR